eukprot:gene10032-11057_t
MKRKPEMTKFQLDFKSFFIANIILISSGYVAGQVFELTEQNFEQYTKDKDVMLVEFYAPWCHHCQDLAPEYEKAAIALAQNREFILGKVDCVGAGKTLCDRFNVQMYPSIKLFRHGQFKEDYQGERNADAVVSYMQRTQAAPVTSAGGEVKPLNTDPWQSGASFQYAYPNTPPPIQELQPQPQNYAPTPEPQQLYPSIARTETKPQPPSINNGNFWSFNNLWNGNKGNNRQATQTFSALPKFNNPVAPSQQRYQPFVAAPQRPAALNYAARPQPLPETASATSSFEYHARDNTPFQASTTTEQIGLNPSFAGIDLPANSPVMGTYQGQLNAQQNNQAGTTVVFIGGQPYAIRRIVNRYSSHHYPINLSAFAPNQRFGPGFVRGNEISRSASSFVSGRANVESNRMIPPRQILPLRNPWLSTRQLPAVARPNNYRQTVLKTQAKPRNDKYNLQELFDSFVKQQQEKQQEKFKLDSRQRINQPQNMHPILKTSIPQRPYVSGKYPVTPNYYQMFFNFLRGKRPGAFEPAQTRNFVSGSYNRARFPNRPTPRPYKAAVQPTQAEMNSVFEGYKRKLTNELLTRVPAYAQTPENMAYRVQNNAPGKGRFVVSIKGQPGSKTAAAIRNKAMSTPGFINKLLNSRSFTDRALIRAKVLRPGLMSKAKWAPNGVTTGTARGNIVYVPRSAFSRLPPWYRPKLGPALVKYVVKADKTRKPFPMLAQANKKQALVKPRPPQDLWHQIYKFYNRKNELQLRHTPNKPQYRPQGAPIFMNGPSMSRYNFPPHNQQQQRQQAKIVNMPASQPKYYVNQALFRTRDNRRTPLFQERVPYSNKKTNLSPTPGPGIGKPLVSNFEKLKAAARQNKPIPPELWDKRSVIPVNEKRNFIPLKPVQAVATTDSNWGTMKKKRSPKEQKKGPRQKRSQKEHQTRLEQRHERYRRFINRLVRKLRGMNKL